MEGFALALSVGGMDTRREVVFAVEGGRTSFGTMRWIFGDVKGRSLPPTSGCGTLRHGRGMMLWRLAISSPVPFPFSFSIVSVVERGSLAMVVGVRGSSVFDVERGSLACVETGVEGGGVSVVAVAVVVVFGMVERIAFSVQIDGRCRNGYFFSALVVAGGISFRGSFAGDEGTSRIVGIDERHRGDVGVFGTKGFDDFFEDGFPFFAGRRGFVSVGIIVIVGSGGISRRGGSRRRIVFSVH